MSCCPSAMEAPPLTAGLPVAICWSVPTTHRTAVITLARSAFPTVGETAIRCTAGARSAAASGQDRIPRSIRTPGVEARSGEFRRRQRSHRRIYATPEACEYEGQGKCADLSHGDPRWRDGRWTAWHERNTKHPNANRQEAPPPDRPYLGYCAPAACDVNAPRGRVPDPMCWGLGAPTLIAGGSLEAWPPQFPLPSDPLLPPRSPVSPSPSPAKLPSDAVVVVRLSTPGRLPDPFALPPSKRGAEDSAGVSGATGVSTQPQRLASTAVRANVQLLLMIDLLWKDDPVDGMSR